MKGNVCLPQKSPPTPNLRVKPQAFDCTHVSITQPGGPLTHPVGSSPGSPLGTTSALSLRIRVRIRSSLLSAINQPDAVTLCNRDPR